MEKVDQYIQRAKRARAKAQRAAGNPREEFESIADEWEYMAKERLELLEQKLQQGKLDWGHERP